MKLTYILPFFFALLLCISISKAAEAQTYSCATNSAIQKVCDLAFFSAAINLSVTIQTAKTYDTLLSTTFPNFTGAQFSQNYLSPSLQSLAHIIKFDTISLLKPNLTMNIGKTYAARFSGLLTLFGVQNIQLDALVMKSVPNGLFLSANLPFSSLGTILASFFPMNINKVLEVMGGGSSLSLIVTNKFDFANITELRPSYIIGVTSWNESTLGLYANLRLTTGTNPISQFLRRYLGDNAALQLAVTLGDSVFNGFIGIADFQVSSRIAFTQAGVSIKIDAKTPEPTISIGATMKLLVKDYFLTFTGALIFKPIDVGMSFTMKGVWINAFGLDRVYFGNLLLSGAISYAGVPSEFVVGAEIAVGLQCYDVQTFQGNGYCLRAQGYVGIDIVDPNNNYFYLQVSTLSLDVIMRAFLGSKTEQTIPIPEMLNNALQFPQGLQLSYSLLDKDLVNVRIRAGYVMIGQISVFGATATCNIQILTLAKKISAYLAISPINFGNVLTLNGDSPASGPYMNITAVLFPPVLNVQMAAKVTVLGISASVQVVILLERLYFYISGPLLFGALTADLSVELTNANFKAFNFGISANIKMNQEMLDLIQFVTNAVSQSLNAAKNKVDNGQSEVNKATSNVAAKRAEICADVQAKCQRQNCATKGTQCDQYGQKDQCSQQESQCTGGWVEKCDTTEKKCTSSVWSWLSFICKGWGYVCTHTSKVCNGWGTVCMATTKVIDYTKCVASHEICQAYNWILDTSCQAACKISEAGLSIAIGSMNTANSAMQVVENSFGGLAKAFDYVSKNIVKVFNIRNAGFSIVMNAGNKSTFNAGISVNLQVTILGKDSDKTLTFTFNDMEKIRKVLIDEVLATIKTTFK